MIQDLHIFGRRSSCFPKIASFTCRSDIVRKICASFAIRNQMIPRSCFQCQSFKTVNTRPSENIQTQSSSFSLHPICSIDFDQPTSVLAVIPSRPLVTGFSVFCIVFSTCIADPFSVFQIPPMITSFLGPWVSPFIFTFISACAIWMFFSVSARVFSPRLSEVGDCFHLRSIE